MARGDGIDALIKDVDKMRDKLLKYAQHSRQTAIKDRSLTVAVKRAEKATKPAKRPVPAHLRQYVFTKKAK